MANETRKSKKVLKKSENLKTAHGKGVASTDLLYCDDCEHLNPKEHEQSKKKEAHLCMAWIMPLFHNGHHPRILRPKKCYLYQKANTTAKLSRWLRKGRV